jgi:alkylation response protein AidB-like acyl-CoA dehydrogenase
MDFRLRPDVADRARDVHAFLDSRLTPQIRERMLRTGSMHDAGLHRELAERGWLAAAAGETPADPHQQAVLFRELELAEAPYHGLSVTMMVIGVLDRLGSDELKARVLPKLLSGETIAALGYSEPGAGSDVAAATTRAEPVDGEAAAWRINGQKMWTTLAQEAGYVLLLTRTSTDAAKHRGLTIFLVPLDAPGITIQAIHTMADERTNIVFYDDVLVADTNRIGDVNAGWSVMNLALSFERGVMGGTAMLEPLVRHAVDWARTPAADGSAPAGDPAVLEALAQARIDAEVAFLLTQRTAVVGAGGQSPSLAGNAAKLFASTAYQRAAGRLQEVAGEHGVMAGTELERAVRHSAVTTIQGGTTEVQRNHAALHGLGLPRPSVR